MPDDDNTPPTLTVDDIRKLMYVVYCAEQYVAEPLPLTLEFLADSLRQLKAKDGSSD